MQWTRSETLALAMHQCAQCNGSGLRLARKGALAPCNCVLRTIFRICYNKFQKCVTQERHLSKISLEPHAGRNRPYSWGRKDEEFIADFCLLARRALTPAEHTLFRYHFILGADWKLCARKLGLDRGNTFHAIYRIEQKLGRMFREVEPYPLFPLDDYFHGPSRFGPQPVPKVIPEPQPIRPGRLSFPPIGRTA